MRGKYLPEYLYCSFDTQIKDRDKLESLKYIQTGWQQNRVNYYIDTHLSVRKGNKNILRRAAREIGPGANACPGRRFG